MNIPVAMLTMVSVLPLAAQSVPRTNRDLPKVPSVRKTPRIRLAANEASAARVVCSAARIYVPKPVYMPNALSGVSEPKVTLLEQNLGGPACEQLPSTKVTYQR